MAGDRAQKTEKPTERRKKKAKSDGQVPRSQDIVPWLLVLVFTFALPKYISSAGNTLSTRITQIRVAAADPTMANAGLAVRGALVDTFQLTLPLLIGSAAIALAASIAQTGPVFAPKSLKPQPKRLNPVAGLKRIVSIKGQWEAAKATMRLGAVALVAIPIIRNIREEMGNRPDIELGHALALVGGTLLDLARRGARRGLLLSAADFVVQRKNHLRDLMMTKQEVKDDHKQSDGDPMVKGRMRRAAQELSRNRVLANASDASVIVVNPTHFSVAVAYDPEVGVPVVVAKGSGAAALKLRSEGLVNAVPVVECKPLARALFRVCDVGSTVPSELFHGVAVLLAFVQRLGNRRSLGGIHVLPTEVDALGLPDRLKSLVS